MLFCVGDIYDCSVGVFMLLLVLMMKIYCGLKSVFDFVCIFNCGWFYFEF